MEEYRQDQDEIEIDLEVVFRNFFHGIARFWWLLLILALAGSFVMYVKAARFYTPMYRSTASFTVMTGNDEESYSFFYDTQSAGQLAKTFPYILGSSLLTDAIEEDLGVPSINGSISAFAVSDSNLITMSVVSSNPQDAKDILDSAIRVYPDVARFVIGPTRFNMIDVPAVPTAPYNRPSYRRNVEMGALGGLGVGVVFLGLYAFFKRTVQKPEELKSVLNIPCVGQIPKVRKKARWKNSDKNNPALDQRVLQNFQENLQGLQLKVERDLENRSGNVVLVTSTSMGEGKAALSLNLAYTAAKHGKKVLLIDADLRKQDTRKRLTDKPGKGLGEVLEGSCPLKKAIETHEKSKISYLCGSAAYKKPGSLLIHEKLEQLLNQLRQEYDLILLDAPPAELFADAGTLAQCADSVLYIIRYDYIQKWRILDCIYDLQKCGAEMMGYVFNAAPSRRGRYGYGRYGYGYYGYGYGYGSDQRNKKEQEKADEA